MDTPQETTSQELPNNVPPVPVLKKRLSPNTVNIIIFLLISFFLLFDFVFRSLSCQFEQLRLFGVIGNDPNLLLKLLPLRVGIAFVFFWYGFDNYQHPEVMNNITNVVLKKLKMEKGKINLIPFGYVQSAIEVLVGLSLITGIFMDLGALIGSLLLFAVLFAYEEGVGSLLVRDIGLLGATLTLFILTLTYTSHTALVCLGA